jgi:hypothetical protein
MYARWRNALPLLCDSTAKGGRLPQATRGGLCPTNPCALIGAARCGVPTYRARSLTPTPTAPTLPRSHLTRAYTYGKGKASASHPCRHSVARRLRLVVLRRLRGRLRASARFKTTSRVTSALHPRALQRSPVARFSACPLLVCGGSQQTPLRVVCFGRVRSTPPHTFETQPKGRLSYRLRDIVPPLCSRQGTRCMHNAAALPLTCKAAKSRAA